MTKKAAYRVFSKQMQSFLGNRNRCFCARQGCEEPLRVGDVVTSRPGHKIYHKDCWEAIQI